ncbi:MAG: phosphoribosylanthranilate isomerase [Chthoniobacterales bacterium]|nr:phosphoribosylanthranilate isomerase [Chthoniobacterales bacterium]
MLEFENEVAVKICGVTNLRDAITCAAAGADMLGLNFSPRSLRCIEPGTAQEIVDAVRAQTPQTKFVGVFLDQEAAVVEALAAKLALDAVQLHGHETTEYVRAVKAPLVIKALRVAATRPDVAAYQCGAILLDTWSARGPGGTGETFPWALAAALRPAVNRLILAGGLTSANVAEAIREVRPFAVDVCSGVESTPGKKDEGKVRAFLQAVKELNDEKTVVRA